MKINIVVDNPESWFNPYAERFLTRLCYSPCHTDDDVKLLRAYTEIEPADITFLLSCGSIVPPEFLAKSKHNIVVHASELPKGKGFSPTTWQVLEGKDVVHLTLFEAVEKFDSGLVYNRDTIDLGGHELIDEIRDKLARRIVEMCLEFIEQCRVSAVEGEPQTGEGSYYRKRTPEDSELDIDKTIREQFNLLRVVDNEQYPAFFDHKGRRYVLRIEKIETGTIGD